MVGHVRCPRLPFPSRGGRRARTRGPWFLRHSRPRPPGRAGLVGSARGFPPRVLPPEARPATRRGTLLHAAPPEWSAPGPRPRRSARPSSPEPAPRARVAGAPCRRCCASLGLRRCLPPSSMASLLCCGPKLAACGIVLSAWGVIMLVRGPPRENRSGSGRSGVEGLGGQEPPGPRKQQADRGAGEIAAWKAGARMGKIGELLRQGAGVGPWEWEPALAS